VASGSGKRYAKAVFELAQQEGSVDAWAKRLQAVRDLLGQEAVRQVVANPTLPPRRRLQALEALATREMGQEGLNLARLLVEAGRVGIVGDLVNEYEQLADAASGRLRATATTAVELSQQERTRIREQLSRRFGREVRLEVRVDPDIIGGLVLEVGDRLIDASVAGRLQQLRRTLVAP
jgi:F-type H+-transporting ATPase subunit delta